MNDKTKKTDELTADQIKAIKIDDEILEKINGGMFDITNTNRDGVTFAFSANQAVYDNDRNCTAYVIGNWPQQDVDGLWRAAYLVGGSYNGAYDSWITWERNLDPVSYNPSPTPIPVPGPGPKPIIYH